MGFYASGGAVQSAGEEAAPVSALEEAAPVTGPEALGHVHRGEGDAVQLAEAAQEEVAGQEGGEQYHGVVLRQKTGLYDAVIKEGNKADPSPFPPNHTPQPSPCGL